MERTFATVLQAALDAKSWTAYQLSEATGVPRSGLSNYLSGKTVPEDKTLAKLVDALGADYDQLKAFADVHRLGIEGVSRIRKYVPEVLEGGRSQPAVVKVSADVLDQVPDRVRPTLKKSEVEALRHLGPDLESVNLGPGSYVWDLPPDGRLRVLKQAVVDLQDGQDDSQAVGDNS